MQFQTYLLVFKGDNYERRVVQISVIFGFQDVYVDSIILLLRHYRYICQEIIKFWALLVLTVDNFNKEALVQRLLFSF